MIDTLIAGNTAITTGGFTSWITTEVVVAIIVIAGVAILVAGMSGRLSVAAVKIVGLFLGLGVIAIAAQAQGVGNWVASLFTTG